MSQVQFDFEPETAINPLKLQFQNFYQSKTEPALYEIADFQYMVTLTTSYTLDEGMDCCKKGLHSYIVAADVNINSLESPNIPEQLKKGRY